MAAAAIAEPTAAVPSAVPPEQVHVRMYRALEPIAGGDKDFRGLLGDCFLIRLQAGAAKSHILIDCGMLLGSPQAQQRMQAVAADISTTCGGRLDLLVVTHEHWDHLSGFSQAAGVLLDPAQLAIGTVWMAWTENPADPDAQGLRARFDRSGFALASIADRLRDPAAPFGIDAASRTMGGLDAFMGLAAGSAQDQPRLATRDILQKLKDVAGQVCYLTPGQTWHTSGAVSLPAYVLGPPHDLQLLFRDKPSRKTPETYLAAPTVDGAQLMRIASGGAPDPAKDSLRARLLSVHDRRHRHKIGLRRPGGRAVVRVPAAPLSRHCGHEEVAEGRDGPAPN